MLKLTLTGGQNLMLDPKAIEAIHVREDGGCSVHMASGKTHGLEDGPDAFGDLTAGLDKPKAGKKTDKTPK